MSVYDFSRLNSPFMLVIRRLSPLGERDILQTVSRVRNIVALILLTLWPVMTSHALLQHFSLIHEVHAGHDSGGGSHEHDADNHAFADGDYLRGSSDIWVWKPIAATAVSPFATALLLALVTLARRVFNSGPAPPGTAPPELSHRWQFFFRAALPVRAPSFVS